MRIQKTAGTFPPARMDRGTDHGEVPTFWNSFSTSHRRIQEGGWSRQVTVQDFPLSKDIAGVNMRLGHYVENTGTTDLIFIEMFKADRFMDLSLSDWMTHAPPALISQHLGISEELLRTIPKDKTVIMPA